MDERIHIQSIIVGACRPGYLREACFFQTHPDFNKTGRWEGCKADRELKARGKKGRELKLKWKSRADGTHLPTESSPAEGAPIPPRNPQRSREHDRRDRDGGCGGRGGRGQVFFDKDKGSPCRTSIITHLSCNCGSADINSTYRQCLVSMHNSTKSDNILKSIEVNVIDSCIEVIIGLPDIRSNQLVHRIPSYFDSPDSTYLVPPQGITQASTLRQLPY